VVEQGAGLWVERDLVRLGCCADEVDGPVQMLGVRSAVRAYQQVAVEGLVIRRRGEGTVQDALGDGQFGQVGGRRRAGASDLDDAGQVLRVEPEGLLGPVTRSGRDQVHRLLNQGDPLAVLNPQSFQCTAG
jgi:hypothetical protein